MTGMLGAELRKLRRPLWWASALAVVGFCLLLAWGATVNAAGGLSGPKLPIECVGSTTSECAARVAAARQLALTDAADLAALLRPGRVGTVAAGMLASMPGVLVVALLAGGHVGAEWSGRTIRSLLTHERRRWRVLLVKWVSLWLAAVGCMLACWAALAAAGPVLSAVAHLPGNDLPWWDGTGATLVQLGRAAAVLAVFAAVAVAAATVTRNVVGTIAATIGLVAVTLMVGASATLRPWTPASSVQAWMGFGAHGGYLPTSYWSRFLDDGAALGTARAVLGLLASAAVAAVVAGWRMRADVTV